MNGLSVEAHLGRTVREVVPALADERRAGRCAGSSRPASPSRGSRSPARPRRSRASQRTWIESWMPVRGRRDEVIGISVTAEEITERRRVEQLRDTFIGMLSHELRTPITSLYAAGQLLRNRRRTAARTGATSDLVDEVVAGAERLQRIVENLLVLARVERGVALPGRRSRAAPARAAGVLDAERRLWPDAPHRAGGAAAGPAPGPLRRRRAGPGAAQPRLERRQVRAARRPDPGVGRCIAADVVCLAGRRRGARAWARWTRSGCSTSTTAPRTPPQRAAGAGIGLFVSRALVEAMGGTLTAADREVGGAEFAVCLPVFAED